MAGLTKVAALQQAQADQAGKNMVRVSKVNASISPSLVSSCVLQMRKLRNDVWAVFLFIRGQRIGNSGWLDMLNSFLGEGFVGLRKQSIAGLASGRSSGVENPEALATADRIMRSGESQSSYLSIRDGLDLLTTPPQRTPTTACGIRRRKRHLAGLDP